MNVSRYTDPQKFYTRIETYLEAEEAKNSLILGIVQRLVKSPNYNTNPYLGLVEDGDEIQLVAMHTPPFPMVLASHLPEPVHALDLLVGDVIASGFTPSDVFGPEALGKLYAQNWAQRSGGNYQLDMAQGLYALQKVNQDTLTAAAGKLRRATQADFDLLMDWGEAFLIEALQEQPTTEMVRERTERSLTDIYIWEVAGEAVSMCSRNRPTNHSCSIGYVYTPPEQRRHGYATAMVAQVSQLLLDEGYQFCTLYTNMANATSNAIYVKIGYEWVCGADKWKLKNIVK